MTRAASARAGRRRARGVHHLCLRDPARPQCCRARGRIQPAGDAPEPAGRDARSCDGILLGASSTSVATQCPPPAVRRAASSRSAERSRQDRPASVPRSGARRRSRSPGFARRAAGMRRASASTCTTPRAWPSTGSAAAGAPGAVRRSPVRRVWSRDCRPVARLVRDGETAAWFGEVARGRARGLGIARAGLRRRDPAGPSRGCARPPSRYDPLPRYPRRGSGTSRSWSRRTSDGQAQSIEAAIRGLASPLLRALQLFDVYRGCQVGRPQPGLRPHLPGADRTLTDAEVNEYARPRGRARVRAIPLSALRGVMADAAEDWPTGGGSLARERRPGAA